MMKVGSANSSGGANRLSDVGRYTYDVTLRGRGHTYLQITAIREIDTGVVRTAVVLTQILG